ncbi:Myc-type, basic helix-loop-helix (bHLH) domain-containing protein [Cynara cardunculus var. scolymus]|uniref:Myc-type, basic helix-loop-helix (BHLH) domain-containing protein n=2 Tax=Cynara cardunculus var. scolymus TaxID=59895 RepID=A0A103YGG2_CYNCS|nr:Myc-type, basic helix-loop-helix (bHLH) domain-containing protein [Cynara cardunculus var. scolymus]
MQFLPSYINGYDQFSNNCSTIIRDLVGEGTQQLSANTVAEDRAAAASNRHSEAERRRRKRINGHLATLRTLLPNTIKTDKASLLAEVVRRVKELKKMAAEAEVESTSDDDDDYFISRNKEYYMIPSEIDELEVTYVGEDSSMIKACMCCQDRPELMVELRRALAVVGGKLVRTEIGTLGGRIKCVLWVQIAREQGLPELRRSLKVVMDQAAFLDLPRNKRPRI